MENRKIRWGIIGPGSISATFAKDLAAVEDAELVAVASRSSQERAKQFAEEFNVKRAYGTYEELVQDPEVDIVYIGTLHPQHYDSVKICLEAGKAVLCEKPFTINARQAEELINLAREKNIFLMEAMWTRYTPTMVKVREWIAEGLIGDVQLLQASFGFDTGNKPDGRLLNRELGGGALLDVGIYPVSLASMIFGQQPSKISSSVYIGETGVDERNSILFEYENGNKAVLNSAVRLNLVNDAYIYGTKGYIHVPNFWFAPSATLHVHGEEEPVNFVCDRKTRGYDYEAREAMACLRAGKKESSIMPLDETLAILKTLDTLRSQWGLSYPSE